MKLLIDTNVVLDFLLGRGEFFESSKKIVELSSKDDTIEFVTASSVTDIYYFLKRETGAEVARSKLKDLLKFIVVLKVENHDIQKALSLEEWTDFEDAVQYAVALHNAVDFIITRNKKDFKRSSIPVYTPMEFLELYTLENS